MEVDFTQQIKQEAHRLGFEKVGIAPAEKLEAEALHLKKWIADGYHGTMGWMEENIDKRIDPKSILPLAQSIISVAMNYYTDTQHSEDPNTGKISRYAWGTDYHDVLTERLQSLLQFIKDRQPGAEGKVYVDTGPMMDKVWAQRAGIGWQGKHSNLITHDYGSWVFLGEIILNLKLEYDVPDTDHCGSCTLCIEACPTQAITEPYVVDANRCISYLTIEHRGEIARELGEKFDRWIYGCDICQDVCPWNQNDAHPTEKEEFQPRQINIAPKLTDIAAMTQNEFSRQFRKSPMKRTKHSGLIRNASIALSNRKHDSLEKEKQE